MKRWYIYLFLALTLPWIATACSSSSHSNPTSTTRPLPKGVDTAPIGPMPTQHSAREPNRDGFVDTGMDTAPIGACCGPTANVATPAPGTGWRHYTDAQIDDIVRWKSAANVSVVAPPATWPPTMTWCAFISGDNPACCRTQVYGVGLVWNSDHSDALSRTAVAVACSFYAAGFETQGEIWRAFYGRAGASVQPNPGLSMANVMVVYGPCRAGYYQNPYYGDGWTWVTAPEPPIPYTYPTSLTASPWRVYSFGTQVWLGDVSWLPCRAPEG